MAEAWGAVPIIPPGSDVLFSDTFGFAAGAVATDQSYTQSPACPYYGTDNATGVDATRNANGRWRSDSCDLVIVDTGGATGGALTGDPATWAGDKYWFRANLSPNVVTFDPRVGNGFKVAWQFKQGAYGLFEPANIEAGDGTDLWLGYQSQYNLYTVHFARQDNRFVLKRKVPQCNNSSDNYGEYYTLKFDSDSPAGIAGNWDTVGWANLPQGTKDAIAAAEGRTWNNALPTDGTNTAGTWLSFHVTAKRLNTRDLKIQLFRAGVLVASWTDQLGITQNYYCSAHDVLFADYSTHHTLANGHYNVPVAWMAMPLGDVPGASGFRADNVRPWIDNLTVTRL